MIWIYCKTDDHPKEVGEYICKLNFNQGSSDQKSRIIKDDSEEECFIIETNPLNETSAMIYRIGHEVVVTEIDEDCAVNMIEPLMKKYGFNNVKWLLQSKLINPSCVFSSSYACVCGDLGEKVKI